MRRFVPWVVVLAVAIASVPFVASASGQDKPNEREKKVRGDKERVGAMESWIYADLPRGIDEATKSGKPLLVIFRCIPCEACAKLDEDVVSRDPAVAALLDKFVCVRIPHANAMDLSLFQFDYDQSWAAFFLNADLTIYGRYGTRSHQRESGDDVSLGGFAKSLEGALALHAKFPANKALFTAKRGPPSDVAVPEAYPALAAKYTSKLDYEGRVVPSCIHCHQVGEQQRLVARTAGKPVAAQVLFPYPNPKILGLVMDPQERARVKSVTAGSAAEKDGFRAGDDITAVEGQPVLSIADVQWVLNGAGETGKVRCDVVRGGKPLRAPISLTLAAGWRERGDISWRATSWDLRRMVTGGMLLKDDVAADARRAAGVESGGMALRAEHVGQYGAHAVAKQAGFLKGDVLVKVADRIDLTTETALLAWLVNHTKAGDKVPVTVARAGKRVELTLTMQ